LLQDMTNIRFKNLADEEIFDIIDDSIPHILIPNFRPHAAREWWTTNIYLNPMDKIEKLEVRDLTFDLITNKQTVIELFRLTRFNQIMLYQFTKKPSHSLKTDELPENTAENILIQNGLVNGIWVNFEYVELSSISDKYLNKFKDKYSAKLV
jgi:hypothetical protein